MKYLSALLACLALASCAKNIPPRAVIVPSKPIAKVETAPVEKATANVVDAGDKINAANRKANDANEKALSTSGKLADAMARANALAAGSEILRQAWQEAEAFAVQLGNDLLATQSALKDADKEIVGLREHTKALSLSVSQVKSDAAVNAALNAEQFLTLEETQAAFAILSGAHEELVALKATSKQTIKRLKGHRMWLGGLALSLTLCCVGLGYLLFKP